MGLERYSIKTQDPGVRLVVTLCSLSLPVLAPSSNDAAFIFVCWVTPALLLTGAIRNFMRLFARLILPTIIMLFLVHAVLLPETLQTKRSEDGVEIATMLSLRLSAIVGITCAYATSTTPTEMMLGMRRLQLPESIVGTFMASISMVRLIRRRLHTTIEAQRARGVIFDHGIARRVWLLIPLLRPVLFSAMVMAVERANIWQNRGLLRRRTKFASFSRSDWILLAATLLMIIYIGERRWSFLKS